MSSAVIESTIALEKRFSFRLAFVLALKPLTSITSVSFACDSCAKAFEAVIKLAEPKAKPTASASLVFFIIVFVCVFIQIVSFRQVGF